MRLSAKSSGFVRPLWVRMAQLFSLVIWMVGATPVLPSLAAVAADLDGQHEVLLMRTESRVSVVLHHGTGNQAPDHRHSVVSDFLTMVGSDGGMGSDHVLMFSEGEAARQGSVCEGDAGRGGEEVRKASTALTIRLLSAVDFYWSLRAEGVRARGGLARGVTVGRMPGFVVGRPVCLRI